MTFDGPPEVRGVASGLMNRDVAQRVLVVYPRILKAEAHSVPVALRLSHLEDLDRSIPRDRSGLLYCGAEIAKSPIAMASRE
jgi:hypothetical protein